MPLAPCACHSLNVHAIRWLCMRFAACGAMVSPCQVLDVELAMGGGLCLTTRTTITVGEPNQEGRSLVVAMEARAWES